jgi:hypothetical protein
MPCCWMLLVKCCWMLSPCSPYPAGALAVLPRSLCFSLMATLGVGRFVDPLPAAHCSLPYGLLADWPFAQNADLRSSIPYTTW